MPRATVPSRVAMAVIGGYVAGLLPSADLAARLATGGRTDIRSAGSGNPGAANSMKVLGKRWGLAVMVADIAKGVAACRFGRGVAGDVGAHAAGCAAVVGHCYPVTTGFRGGKGVATGVGQVMATFPVYAPIDALVAAATQSLPGWKNRAFAATTVASAFWVGGAALWTVRRWPNLWGPTPTAALPVAAAVSSAVIARRFVEEERRADRASTGVVGPLSSMAAGS